MKTVIYDEYHTHGIPDGIAMDVAETIVGPAVPDGETTTVGTGLVIDAIRLLVKQGKISHTDIQFQYKGVTINIDENGGCSPWPAGFNDTMENILCKL